MFLADKVRKKHNIHSPLPGDGGMAINIRPGLKIKRLEKVSPPFEGGVAATQ